MADNERGNIDQSRAPSLAKPIELKHQEDFIKTTRKETISFVEDLTELLNGNATPEKCDALKSKAQSLHIDPKEVDKFMELNGIKTENFLETDSNELAQYLNTLYEAQKIATAGLSEVTTAESLNSIEDTHPTTLGQKQDHEENMGK